MISFSLQESSGRAVVVTHVTPIQSTRVLTVKFKISVSLASCLIGIYTVTTGPKLYFDQLFFIYFCYDVIVMLLVHFIFKFYGWMDG